MPQGGLTCNGQPLAGIKVEVVQLVIQGVIHERTLLTRMPVGESCSVDFTHELPQAEADCPFVRATAAERDHILAECTRQLTLHQRMILTLHYGHGIAFAAIARRIGVTTPAITASHQRALSSIRKQLAWRRIYELREIL